MPKNMEDLQTEIGYRFQKPEILRTALTHSSYSNELRAKKLSVSCKKIKLRSKKCMKAFIKMNMIRLLQNMQNLKNNL